MKHSWLLTVLGTLALLSTALLLAAQPAPERQKGIFAPLKAGQYVNLKEVGGGYQITVLPDMQLGHKILELGSDYVVLLDAAEVTETRIPIYALRSISITRLPREK